MKKITQKAAVLLLLLAGLLCQAQDPSDVKNALALARQQIIEGSKTYNPASAINSYNQLAVQGNAQAMNALGMIYSKGIGVPVNEVLGIEWTEKAANAGYVKAWYNLAILHKEKEPNKALNYYEKAATGGYRNAYTDWGRMLMKGEGVPQNYPLAVSVFKQGAEKGNSPCQYNLGYLYYKGFGCIQDYKQAMHFFEVAAKGFNPWAMYMLGLCYRNGYGVAIDLEKAKYWLKKSAAMGVKPSQMELADSQAENANPTQTKTVSRPIDEVISITETNPPMTFKKVKQTSFNKNISGNYTGNILRYDWSGQNIISNTHLEIILTQDENRLKGEWKEEGGDKIAFNAEILENAIVFHDTKIDRTEHFYKDRLNTYEFKEAQLQLLQAGESLFLIGNLQLYNIKEQENEKPMYLILEKKLDQTIVTNDSEILSKVVIYPNPFSSNFELRFDLLKETNVTASIHSLTGNLLYSTEWNNLAEGSQNKSINLNAPSGYYILRLNYGLEVKTSILIKK